MRNGKDRMAAIRRNLEALIGEAAAGNHEAQALLDDLSRDRRFSLMIDDIYRECEELLRRKPVAQGVFPDGNTHRITLAEPSGVSTDVSNIYEMPKKQANQSHPAEAVSSASHHDERQASERWGKECGVSLFRQRRGQAPDTYLWKSPQHAPSGVRHTLAMHGEDGVWAAMRASETPMQFKARVAAGHSAAAYAVNFWDGQRRLAEIRRRGGGAI